MCVFLRNNCASNYRNPLPTARNIWQPSKHRATSCESNEWLEPVTDKQYNEANK